MSSNDTCTPALRRIGLLGGMSWESSTVYYQQINTHVRNALGHLYSAPIVLDSINFAHVEQWQRNGEWDKAAEFLSTRMKALELAGAQCIGIATNTMHKVYDELSSAVSVPTLHIASPTIAALQAAGLSRVAFLGTRYSMEDNFLKDRYDAANITLMMPDAAARDAVQHIIFQELCQGKVLNESRDTFKQIVSVLQAQGAQAIVLGCTEITLLMSDNDVDLPMFDTTALHTRALADFVLNQQKVDESHAATP